jgi:plastocyanin
MNRTRWTVVGALLGLVLLVAACGGGSGGGKKSGAKQTPSGTKSAAVGIRESEYKLNPTNPKVASASVVLFQVRNDGTVPHAFEVKGPKGEVRTQAIQPGSSATLKADLSKPGSYVFYCPIDGHRKLGMAGQVIVAGGGKSGASPSTGGTKPAPSGGKSGGGSSGKSSGGSGGGYGS